MNDFVEFEGLLFFKQRKIETPVSKSSRKGFLKKLKQKWVATRDKTQNVPALHLGKDNDSSLICSPVRNNNNNKSCSSSIQSSTCSPTSVFDHDSLSPTTPPTPELVVEHLWREQTLKDLSPPLDDVSMENDSLSDDKVITESPTSKSVVEEVYNPDQAAILIQRIIRGGMQRMHYKIMRLQRLLDTSQERTDAAIAAIHKRAEKRKATLLAKLEEKERKDQKRNDQTNLLFNESTAVIDHLVRENKKLRESNDKIDHAIQMLIQETDHLSNANAESDGSLSILAKRIESIEETNRELLEIIPQFQARVENMVEAVETRKRYHKFERNVRNLYVKLTAKISERVEDVIGGSELGEEIVQLCLGVKEHDIDTFGSSFSDLDGTSDQVLPNEDSSSSGGKMRASLGEPFFQTLVDRDEEDEEIDAYTVHTMGD